MFEIYLHRCTVTGKGYVGYTMQTMMRRWTGHCSEALGNNRDASELNYFKRAIRKYGRDAWTHDIIEANIATKAEACAAEIRWIVELGTLAPVGYNSVPGGSGVTLTPEIKEKHRVNLTIALSDPVVRAKMCAFQKANKNDPEYRIRNSAQQKVSQNRSDIVAKKRVAMLKHTAREGYVNPRSKPIAQFDDSGNVIAVFGSAAEAGRKTGVPISSLAWAALASVREGELKRAGGYAWKYLPKKETTDE
jgi:predicted GIY-YIG superfamily endonuclease